MTLNEFYDIYEGVTPERLIISCDTFDDDEIWDGLEKYRDREVVGFNVYQYDNLTCLEVSVKGGAEITDWILMEDSTPSSSGYYLFTLRDTDKEREEVIYWDSDIKNILGDLDEHEQLISWIPYKGKV